MFPHWHSVDIMRTNFMIISTNFYSNFLWIIITTMNRQLSANENSTWHVNSQQTCPVCKSCVHYSFCYIAKNTDVIYMIYSPFFSTSVSFILFMLFIIVSVRDVDYVIGDFKGQSDGRPTQCSQQDSV